MKGSGYEGLQKGIKKIRLPDVDTWKNSYPDRDYAINVEIPEFTCICPKTGLPDFADIKIEYIPDRLCMELKSLKYYIIAYRNVGIFNENVVNRMLDDCVRACKPRWMKITGEFNARGGIRTTVRAEYNRRKRPV